MSGVGLSRHELRWVLEQVGADRWPYPLRSPAWAAETETETARHRAHVEGALRARGLLEPEPARALWRAGELVVGWRAAVDLVRRDAGAPCAAVVLTDGADAVMLASAEHADTPVWIAPVPTDDRLAEALLALVPSVPAGVGGPWPVPPAHAPDPPPGSGPFPTTDRAASACAVVDELLTHAEALTEVGVATRAGPAGPPIRASTLVTWLDGPRGRFAVRHPRPGITRPAVLVGVNDQHLLADIHTVLGEAGASRGGREVVGHRSSGRSTA